MHLNEAYQALDLQPGASDEDIKKSFRKMASKYHPDKNKDPDSEEKFKKINQAYQILTNKSTPEQSNDQGGFWPGGFGFGGVGINFGDLNEIFSGININFGNGFNFNEINFERPNISNEITISFSESLLGCERTIKLNRKIRCEGPCNGTGQTANYSLKCQVCSGIGRTADVGGQARRCNSCAGRGHSQSTCNQCGGTGSVEKEAEIKIQIPPGIEGGQILKINGASDYFFENRINRGLYTDKFIKINVIPEPNMHTSGSDVVSTIELTLLEALKGTVKKVKTIRGDLSLKINKNIKNGDRIHAKGYGIAGVGSHVFLIQVNYPENCEKIISLLEEEEKKENR